MVLNTEKPCPKRPQKKKESMALQKVRIKACGHMQTQLSGMQGQGEYGCRTLRTKIRRRWDQQDSQDKVFWAWRPQQGFGFPFESDNSHQISLAGARVLSMPDKFSVPPSCVPFRKFLYTYCFCLETLPVSPDTPPPTFLLFQAQEVVLPMEAWKYQENYNQEKRRNTKRMSASTSL